MQSAALKALEFDRIVEAVCRLAQTPPGSDHLARLHPLSDASAVSAALATTAETARFLSGTGEIALRAPAELDAILAALSVEGRALEPLHLLGLSTFLASVDATVTGIERAPGRRPWSPGGRAAPLPRAAEHRRHQQRHRRARAAGAGRSPPHPPRAGRCVQEPRAGAPPHDRGGDDTRRGAGESALFTGYRRRAPGDLGRRAPRAARRAPPPAHRPPEPAGRGVRRREPPRTPR